MDDAGGRKQTEDGGLTFGAGLGLGALVADDVLGFCRSDGAIEFFGEEFGVAVVGNHADIRRIVTMLDGYQGELWFSF